MLRKPLSTSDWAVLAFLGEGAAHGFRVAAVFAKAGELGRVWTIQRPQVYRAIEHLEAYDFLSAIKQEPGDNGPLRTLYAPTASGQKALEVWLKTPVLHLRDGRSDLILKLIFTERRKLDAEPLLSAQHQHFSTILDTYETDLERTVEPKRIALEWRVQAARAALRFLENKLAQFLS